MLYNNCIKYKNREYKNSRVQNENKIQTAKRTFHMDSFLLVLLFVVEMGFYVMMYVFKILYVMATNVK